MESYDITYVCVHFSFRKMESYDANEATFFQRIYDCKYLCTFSTVCSSAFPFNSVDYLSFWLDVTIIEPIYHHHGCTRSKYVCTIFSVIT